MNPIKGGNPARFIINKRGIHLFIFLLISSKNLRFIFLIIKITNITEIQYMPVKIIKIFVLKQMANIIHLKLKTEEKAIIFFSLFLFIIEMVPKKAEVRMKGRTIFFVWNRIRYSGANFCQVNKIILFIHFMFDAMFTNHWCKGAAADLIIKERIATKENSLTISLGIISYDENKINKAEAIDWIIRYFITVSLFLWFSCFPPVLRIEQKDRVFNSNILQIETQEFTTMQSREEEISKTSMTKLVLRANCLSSNCKFDLIKNFSKSACAIYVLKTYSFS